MKIEQLIKQLRLVKNLKQAWLADQIKISQKAYSKIESGKTALTVERLEAILLVLNVSLVDFIQLYAINNMATSSKAEKQPLLGDLKAFETFSFLNKMVNLK